MGTSQITKPKLEQTTVTATVAEGLLEEANVGAGRLKKHVGDNKMMIILNAYICTVYPGRCFTAGGQYPTAILPIRPNRVPSIPYELLCCLQFII